MHRVNRETDSSLAVQLGTERTATGGDKFSGLPNLPCTAEGTDLSKNPDCGQSFGGRGEATFT